MNNIENKRLSRPEWLKVKAPGGEGFATVRGIVKGNNLHTVCEEAHCPNISECWSRGTATFIILGDVCSRRCRFCAIQKGMPTEPDFSEPLRIAESIAKMKLKHSVITSVTRDDLSDGGAEIWANTILETRKLNPSTTIEVLIPDFEGKAELYQKVFDCKPDILNHNIETVPRLYSTVRPQANYQNSLKLLKDAKEFGLKTKSGLMVGIGESKEEIFECFKDLRKINVDIVTIGQYLQPTEKHLPVARFVHPDEFAEYKKLGLEMGFAHIESAPLVRSSYHAEEAV